MLNKAVIIDEYKKEKDNRLGVRKIAINFKYGEKEEIVIKNFKIAFDKAYSRGWARDVCNNYLFVEVTSPNIIVSFSCTIPCHGTLKSLKKELKKVLEEKLEENFMYQLNKNFKRREDIANYYKFSKHYLPILEELNCNFINYSMNDLTGSNNIKILTILTENKIYDKELAKFLIKNSVWEDEVNSYIEVYKTKNCCSEEYFFELKDVFYIIEKVMDIKTALNLYKNYKQNKKTEFNDMTFVFRKNFNNFHDFIDYMVDKIREKKRKKPLYPDKKEVNQKFTSPGPDWVFVNSRKELASLGKKYGWCVKHDYYLNKLMDSWHFFFNENIPALALYDKTGKIVEAKSSFNRKDLINELTHELTSLVKELTGQEAYVVENKDSLCPKCEVAIAV